MKVRGTTPGNIWWSYSSRFDLFVKKCLECQSSNLSDNWPMVEDVMHCLQVETFFHLKSMYYIKHKQCGCTFVYGLTSIWINAARFRAQVSRLSICPPSGSSLGPPPVPKGSAELLIFLKVSWLVQKIGSSHICRQQCQGLNASGQHSK